MPSARSVAPAAALLALAVSCGAEVSGTGSPASTAAPRSTSAATVTIPPPTTPPATTPPRATPPPAPKTTAAPALVRVPNVVGSDLQSAQERLFPPLRSTSVDASGQGRSQLVDANWIVVRQDPPAGTQVLPLTDITLYVLKRGEG